MLSHVLEGHRDAVWGLAFSPASQRLASCSADGTVRIWDPSSSSPTCLCIPSPQRAVSGGDMGACGTLTGGTGAVQTEAPRGGSPPVPPVPREERGR